MLGLHRSGGGAAGAESAAQATLSTLAGLDRLDTADEGMQGVPLLSVYALTDPQPQHANQTRLEA